jgi:uncharacterized protein (TIGR03437 family)
MRLSALKSGRRALLAVSRTRHQEIQAQASEIGRPQTIQLKPAHLLYRICLYMVRSFCAGLALILSSSVAAWGQQYTINTVAGNATAGFQDGAAASAEFNLPGNIFVTSSGSYYIADGGNNRIRLVSGGNVSTVAGNGTASYSGDGAAATSAYLYDPLGVVADSSGNIFIADTANHVIRKVVPGGNISTYAGNNSYGAGYSGDSLAATNAQLNYPVGLALDSAGNLYIADSGNKLIRKVTASTGIITTVVGASTTTLGKLSHPVGVVLDASGNMYIADNTTSRVYKYTASNGTLTNFAGNGTFGFSGDGGQATFASLGDPKCLALDSTGNLYIADTVNNRIRKVTTDGLITTIAGTGRIGYNGDGGPATSAQLYAPGGIAVDTAGNVYFSDTQNNVIRVLQPTYPAIASGGVGNAASYQPQISPGALATVFGTGFGTATSSPAGTPNLQTNAGGITVTVNGLAAPLYYVSPGQINFQVPWETAVGTASVAVTYNGGASNSVSVPVVAAGPGLFNSAGASIVQNYTIVQNQPNYSLNTPTNPAAGGSTIIAYLTGSGPVSPTVADGAPAPSNPLATSTSSWSATIGSATGQVSFLGLAPGFVGLVQANIVVPLGLAPGTYPLTVSIGGQASNSATISVK